MGIREDLIMIKKIKEFPKPEVQWEHYVSYGETDAMQIVYYGNYFHWFEQARSHFLRVVGISYSELENRGVFLPVIEAYSKYLAPARYEEKISVRTGICEWKRASLTFYYEVYNRSNNDQLINLGFTKHPCINSKGKIVPIPTWLKEMIQKNR